MSAVAVAEPPLVPARDVGQAQAVVLGELGGGVGHAMSLDIAWRGAEDAAVLRQLAHDQVRIVDLLGEADGDVDIVGAEADRAVGEFERHPQLGVRVEEAGQDRHELRLAEGDGRDDAQRALRPVAHSGEQGFGFRHVRGHQRASFVKGPALLGQGDAVLRPRQQAQRNPVLELADLPADGRWRLLQGSRRRREAAGLDDAREQDHLARQVHYATSFDAYMLRRSINVQSPALGTARTKKRAALPRPEFKGGNAQDGRAIRISLRPRYVCGAARQWCVAAEFRNDRCAFPAQRNRIILWNRANSGTFVGSRPARLASRAELRYHEPPACGRLSPGGPERSLPPSACRSSARPGRSPSGC